MNLIRTIRNAPVTAVIVSSLCLNAALTARMMRQQEIIEGLTPRPVLEIGDEIGVIDGAYLSGDSTAIVPTAAPNGVVLYVYAATCGWCERNGDNMRAVFDAARSRGQKVYALALVADDAAEFLAKHGVAAEIVVPAPDARSKYGFGGTPQTLVVGSDGKVIRNWRGAMVESTKSDVEEFFGVRLPGLRPLPAPAQ
jgi:hypothetical protein